MKNFKMIFGFIAAVAAMTAMATELIPSVCEPGSHDFRPVAFAATPDGQDVGKMELCANCDVARVSELPGVSFTLPEERGLAYVVSNLTVGALCTPNANGQYVVPTGDNLGIYAVAKPGYVLNGAPYLISPVPAGFTPDPEKIQTATAIRYNIAYEPGAGEGVSETNTVAYDAPHTVRAVGTDDGELDFVLECYAFDGAWTNVANGVSYAADEVISNLMTTAGEVFVLEPVWRQTAVRISLPTGVQGYSYIVSNLTVGAEGEIASSGSQPGGATYDLPIGAKVAISCVPSDDYEVTGTNPYVITEVTGDTAIGEAELPKAQRALTVKNVTFQQRYPWNGLVDITCDLSGTGKVTLGVTALTNGVKFVEATTITGETKIDLDAAGGVTNGVKFVWDAAEDRPEGFKVGDITIEVSAEKALGGVAYPEDPSGIPGRQFSRSLYIAKDVRAGEVFTAENVRSVRPGFGLHPKFLPEIIGRRAARDLKAGSRFTLDMMEI